jgi:hypothetical protein
MNKIGLTYLPPFNAEIKIISPVQTNEDAQNNLLSIGFNNISQIPSKFSWRNISDINKYKGWKLTKSLLQDPMNQYGCGICWAISTASTLSDRYAIFSRGPNPKLSPTYIASCLNGSLKCEGGYPGNAGKFLEKFGAPSSDCWSYTWCSDDSRCVKGLPGLSELMPKCDDRSECLKESHFKLYKAQINSTKSILNEHAIKLEILKNGPVIAVYRVFSDFILGSIGDFWTKTNGIYMNYPDHDIYNYGKIQCKSDSKKKFASQCYNGNHAIVIVGWGEDIINDPLQKNSKITVKYWIIRNSWGSKWNGDGYFKMAISDKKSGVNIECALDSALIINDVPIGGVTTLNPTISMAPSDTPQFFESYDIFVPEIFWLIGFAIIIYIIIHKYFGYRINCSNYNMFLIILFLLLFKFI